LIQIKKVKKVFPNGLKALDDINIHIAREEFVYLIGPSGAGKSTLLNLVFRADLPTEGEIIIDNFLLSKLTHRQVPLLRRNIGMIFQDYKLLPKRTVYENVAFALRVMHVPPNRIRRHVYHVLDLVNLGQKAEFFTQRTFGGRATENLHCTGPCEQPTDTPMRRANR